MTNTLITANALRAHLIDDEEWTPREVLNMLFDGTTRTHARTENEWLDAIQIHLTTYPRTD